MATITESFNKADSTTLGPDLTWTEIQGNLQVLSNRVRCVSTGRRVTMVSGIFRLIDVVEVAVRLDNADPAANADDEQN